MPQSKFTIQGYYLLIRTPILKRKEKHMSKLLSCYINEPVFNTKSTIQIDDLQIDTNGIRYKSNSISREALLSILLNEIEEDKN
jgi:hypothetical protein